MIKVYSVYGIYPVNADFLTVEDNQYILKRNGLIVAAFPVNTVSEIYLGGQ